MDLERDVLADLNSCDGLKEFVVCVLELCVVCNHTESGVSLHSYIHTRLNNAQFNNVSDTG